MPPRRCVRRRAVRCSPAATRRTTGWSGWRITAGSTAPASARCPTFCPNPVGTPRYSACSTRRRIPRGSASTNTTFELLLRIRRRAGRRLAHRRPQRAVPAHRGLLRNAPARIRATATSPPIRDDVGCPTTCPTPPTSDRTSPSSTDRSRSPTPRSGRLLDALAETGLDESTWVVFMTDHGPALPRAKSTLYDAGTGIAMIVRPPRATASIAQVYDELFSGVDLLPTLLELLGLAAPAEVDGMSHAALCVTPRNGTRCAPRSTRRRRITTRSIRSAPSGQRNTATSRTTHRGRCSICRGTSPTARPVGRWRRGAAATAARELYDLRRRSDRIAQPAGTRRHRQGRGGRQRPCALLHDWRQKTNDVIPSEFAGTRIAERYTETYLQIHGPVAAEPPRRESRHRRRRGDRQP